VVVDSVVVGSAVVEVVVDSVVVGSAVVEVVVDLVVVVVDSVVVVAPSSSQPPGATDADRSIANETAVPSASRSRQSWTRWSPPE
jgi:hypothetical protein